MASEIPPGGGPNYIPPLDLPPPPPTPPPETKYGAGNFNPGGSGGAASLGLPLPPIGGDLMIEVLEFKTKLEQTGINTARNEAEANKEEKKLLAEQRLEHLKAQQEASGKAQKGGLAGKIFGWVAAAAMVIAGAALIATGAGAAAGIALLAGGLTMMVTMVLQDEQLGKAMGLEGSLMQAMTDGLADLLEGAGLEPEVAKLVASAIIVGTITAIAVIAGSVAGGPFLGMALGAQTLGMFFTPENLEAMGVSKEDAPWVALGINAGLALVGIGAGVGAAKMPGGVAKSMADAAAKAAQAAGTTAGAAAGATTGMKIGAYSTGVAAAMGVAQGGSQVYTGIKGKEAADAQADAAETAAQMAALQQYFQQITEQLEEAVERMQNSYEMIMGIFNQTAAVEQKIWRPA